VIHAYDAEGKAHPCRILLDSGSQLNFVTEDFAKKLHLDRRFMNLPISGIAQESVEARASVDVMVQSRFNAYRRQLRCIVLPKTQKLPQKFIRTSHFRFPSNIQLADPNFNNPSDIDLLVGAEVFWQLICISQIKGCKDHPTLQKTKFGWILSGRIAHSQKENKNASCHLTTIDDIDETISKFWQVENDYRDNTNPLSIDELTCERVFQETTRRNSEGRFIVKFPARPDILSQLRESREIAKQRFFALEKRLARQPEVYAEYRNFMREYQILHHMQQIEVTEFDSIHYYLPHYAVSKDFSTTTKLRVVFDASCKTLSGICLNDALLVGPVVQQDLFSILSRFHYCNYRRRYKNVQASTH